MWGFRGSERKKDGAGKQQEAKEGALKTRVQILARPLTCCVNFDKHFPSLGFSFHICKMGLVTQPCITKSPASREGSLGKALGEQGSFPCAASLPGGQGWAAGRGQVVAPAARLLSLDAPAQHASKLLLHILRSGSQVGLGALSVSSYPRTSRLGPSL